MIIKGQKFYDMLESSEVVKFGVSDVSLVTMETVVIEYVDDDFNTVGEQTLHIVCVLLESGKFVATRPHHDQDFVATIAYKLVEMCEVEVARRN